MVSLVSVSFSTSPTQGDCCSEDLSLQCFRSSRIGKEVERKAQEGEDIGSLEDVGPRRYQSRQTANTRAVDPGLQKLLEKFSLRELSRSELSRDTIIQARRRARVHPDSRARLEQTVQTLEREIPPPHKTKSISKRTL